MCEGNHARIEVDDIVGGFWTSGILSAPYGALRIEVSLDVDTCNAAPVMDTTTGKSDSITNWRGHLTKGVGRMASVAGSTIATVDQWTGVRSYR